MDNIKDIAAVTAEELDKIRVFTECIEEALESDVFSDCEHGSRAELRALERLIIAVAKQYGQYIEFSKTKEYGERVMLRSGESVVYYNEKEGRVYKVKDPFARLPIKGHSVFDVFYEHIVHNLLFPNVSYRFEGVTEGMDGPRFVLTQDYIGGCFSVVSQRRIVNYLEDALGFKKEGDYFMGNDYLKMTDMSATSDNVLVDDQGTLYFIDPIFGFKKPAKEVVEHYQTLKRI